MKKIFLLCSVIALTAFNFPSRKKTITLWLVGDSTMANKEVKAYPETGWGMPFKYFWDSTVVVDNRAMNGRSTRTFIEEKRWEAIMKKMRAGDYVFVQFGHNDEVPTKKSYVTEQQFHDYLTGYINDTRSKDATPILITPVARRKFDSTGHIQDTHTAYAQIMRNVAKESNTALIDLSKKSMDYYQQLGPETSKYLFNYLTPGEHPNYPDGKQDDTHFSELGARKIAELVLAEIRTTVPELASKIVVIQKP